MEKENNFEIFVKVYFPIIIVVIVLAFSLLIAGNMNLRRQLKQERQEKEIIDTTYSVKSSYMPELIEEDGLKDSMFVDENE